MRAPVRVVLDANVLYPFTLRDTLLRAAADGHFQLYWSREILDEAHRSLVASAGISRAQADRLLDAMTSAFPEALVSGHEHLIASMPSDRHVAAVAVVARAQVIVTSNLKDFRQLPEDVEARSPDEFLTSLLRLDPEGLVAILREQAAALRRPPHSFEELLGGLARVVPGFVRAVRELLESRDSDDT